MTHINTCHTYTTLNILKMVYLEPNRLLHRLIREDDIKTLLKFVLKSESRIETTALQRFVLQRG